MMRLVLDTIGGIYELMRLAVLSLYRPHARYWQWRIETAFGRGWPGRIEALLAVLEYGRWMHRMRHGR
ncbi:MAG: hypothetical protein KAS72_03915 [Phycisphaerales bacterium]|nr:hypothetical protein [Phycisphaerales bacterium]